MSEWLRSVTRNHMGLPAQVQILPLSIIDACVAERLRRVTQVLMGATPRRFDSCRMHKKTLSHFRHPSIVASTPRCGRGDPGSIPGGGKFNFRNGFSNHDFGCIAQW